MKNKTFIWPFIFAIVAWILIYGIVIFVSHQIGSIKSVVINDIADKTFHQEMEKVNKTLPWKGEENGD